MIETLVLPDALRIAIGEAARAAFPRECCGLLEGTIAGNAVRVAAVHPTRNLAVDADRFEIDPAEQIRLMKMLRGTGRDIVGCYHSHPNGRAEPSPRDTEAAFGEGFVWVIASVTGDLKATTRAFEIGAESVRELAIAADVSAPA